MSEWPMVKLGEVCRISIGKTPARKEPRYWGDGLPWLSIKDMNQGPLLNATSETITDTALSELNISPYPAGTVLFSFKLSIGKVGITTKPMFTNEAIAAIEPHNINSLDKPYLAEALRFIGQSLEGNAAVMGITLNKKSLAEINIPRPPLAEQKRIAEILLKVGVAIKKTEQQITLTEMLKEAEYNSLSNEIQDFKPLKAIGVNKVTGKSIVAKSDQAHNKNRVIKVSAVSSGSFIPSESKPLPMDYIPNKSHKINQGDLLFARASGSAKLLGACCIVEQQVENLYLPDKVWKLEVNEEILPKEYLLQALRSKKFRAIAESFFSSSTGVKNIKSSVLMDFTIPIPTRNQLQDFSNFIAFADSLSISLYRKLTLLQELQRSLSARAFAGLL